MNDPVSILVVKPSSLGDIVHTLPSVRQLKERWPQSTITWVANTEWLPLIDGHPSVDQTVEFPRKHYRGLAAPLRMRGFLQKLRACGPYDLALDYQGLFRSAFIARASGAKEVIGMSDTREGASLLHKKNVEVETTLHAVDRYLQLTREVTGVEAPAAFDLPPGHAPGHALPGHFIALHPFSRGAGKSLSAEWVEAFCQAAAPLPVVVIGFANTRFSLPPNALNLLNSTTLPELIHVLRRSAFTVSVDSGPAHLAAALSSNLLAIHSWSNPLKVGPYRDEALVWKNGEIRSVGEWKSDLTEAAMEGVLPALDAVPLILARCLPTV